MPSLGADMDSGRIVEWLVQPGDVVHRGDVVAVVDTTKAALDVEVFEDGVITELLVPPGTEVEVGTPLAIIGEADTGVSAGAVAEQEQSSTEEEHERAGQPPPPVRHLAKELGVDLRKVSGSGPEGTITRKDIRAAAERHEEPEPATPSAPEPTIPPKPEATPEGRQRVSPRARRLASRLGVDLQTVTGTGASEAITGSDVEQAHADTGRQLAPPPEKTNGDRQASRRAATAALMARSAREVPHYYVSSTIDVSQTMSWLRDHNAGLPVRRRVLPAALFLRGTVLAAQAHPELNGHWVDGTFIPADGVQLGVAVSMRDGGLLTPVIVDAHLLDLDELMARLSDLVRRARSGRLRSREIEPGSITVSSLADGGPDTLFGVIYPPQVALVGVGAVAERPWAVDGALTTRTTVTLTVAADHRATDGRIGAAFLSSLSTALTEPEDL